MLWKSWLLQKTGGLIVWLRIQDKPDLTQDLNSHVEANVLHSIPVESFVEFGALGLMYVLLFAIIFLKTHQQENLLLTYIVTSFALSGLFYWI